MLYYLCHFESFYGPLRLFRYVTFRGVMALLTALFWGMYIGPKIFRQLQKWDLKDVERSADEVRDLSRLHQHKAKIPTMGGIVIVSGVLLASLLWLKMNVYSYGALFSGIVLSCIGMVDDGLKIRFKNTRGIASYWKWLIQGSVVLILLCCLLSIPGVSGKIDSLYIPFCKQPIFTTLPAVALFFYWFFVFAGTSNALNLTDGIDGLAIGCSLPVLLTYSIFSYVTGNIVLSHYLHLPYLNGVEELTVLCLAITGAGIAFLWYNACPAEIFMGDTGSLALGAWIGCVALMTQQAFTLIIVGFVFVLEALSVILQVTSFKLFRRRCFKMSPLHHHFELSGVPESKLVIRFWIISLLCALLGLITLKLR